MRAGPLDRRVSIQRLTRGVDGYNRPTESWGGAIVRSASWRRATANERLVSGQVGAQVTDVFELRWSSAVAAVNPNDRLSYAGRVYDIVEVTETGRRDGLLIRASARADI